MLLEYYLRLLFIRNCLHITCPRLTLPSRITTKDGLHVGVNENGESALGIYEFVLLATLTPEQSTQSQKSRLLR